MAVPSAPDRRTDAATRSARLLFADELRDGRIGESDLDDPAVRAAVGDPERIPALPSRVAQRLRHRRGSLGYEDDCVETFDRARRAVLGDGAAGSPRFLIRVDEFPHYEALDKPASYGLDGWRRWDDLMAGGEVPYLVALVARHARQPLDPADRGGAPLDADEIAELHRLLARDGVSFAQHGLDHRTVSADPRRHSELSGRDDTGLVELLDTGAALLREAAAIEPRVLVPPYNRFDPAQWPLLAERFDVIGGGPENIALMGWSRTPVWRGDAVWMPAYAPLYARARDVLPAVRRLVERNASVWVPVVLHWGWEADEGWGALGELVDAIAPYAARWDDFLDAVEASR